MTSFQRRLLSHSRIQFQCKVAAKSQQLGLTLVELMVALVISLLISLVAISALTVTQRGFTTVDAASQLRDNGRFTADLIQRLVVQTGFKDVWYAARFASPVESSANPPPNIMGFNNALSISPYPSASTARTTGVDGYGSDVLILRNQLVQLNADSNDADGSMIDCMGNTLTTGAAPSTRLERMTSILSVAVSNGEPSLMCATVKSDNTVSDPQPIIRGVENFQVLYGVDNVTAGAASAATYGLTANATIPAPLTIFTPSPATAADTQALAAWQAAWADWRDSINQTTDSYLRADQLTIASDPVGSYANWRRVRSLRIGMILRGPPNSAQNVADANQKLYPLGLAKASATGIAGSAFSSANDPGTIFPVPTDGRLRQVVTFTVHLRNDQSL